MRLRTPVIALAIVLLTPLGAEGGVRVRTVRDLPDHVPGEVLVKFKASSGPAERQGAVRAFGGLRVRPRGGFDKVILAPGTSVGEAVRALRENPSVEWVQPNHRFYALCLPTDPYFSDNTWPSLLIEAPAGWDAAVAPATCPGTVPGSSAVTVAVIDTGAFTAHPDFAPTLASSTAWWNSVDGNGDVTDENGHGTFLCGLIAANWDGSVPSVPYGVPCNSTPPFTGGIAGMAGRVTILPVKVLDADGYGSTESISTGIDHAVSMGAKVLNLSLGGPQFDRAEKEAVDRAVAAGCVVVAAAGNEAGAVLFPAAYPPVVAVGAVGPGGTVASYSNRGEQLDLMAPGGAGTAVNATQALATEILSTLKCPFPTDYYPHSTGDTHYGCGAGTSFATPYVSAAAALLWSVHPAWTAAQVMERILSTTVDIGAAGWDPVSGYGLLNLRRALAGEVQRYSFTKTFNSPNPFRPEADLFTNITLVLDAPARVELEIRDAAGRRVFIRTYEPSELNANPHNPQYKSYFVSWDGRNGAGNQVVTGVYPYSVKALGSTQRGKIAVIRGRR